MNTYEILNFHNHHLCYQDAATGKDAVNEVRSHGLKTAVKARLVVKQDSLTSAISYAYGLKCKAKINKINMHGWRVIHLENAK